MPAPDLTDAEIVAQYRAQQARMRKLASLPRRGLAKPKTAAQLFKERLIAEGTARAKATREKARCEALTALNKHLPSGR